MNYRNILFNLSTLILIMGVLLAISAGMGIVLKDNPVVIIHIIRSTILILTIGLCGFLGTAKRNRERLRSTAARESFLTITLGWFLLTLLGALPLKICCNIPYVDAIFETASGLSTTGATIIDKTFVGKSLEELPKCILLWRALLNWIGGIGFVMFALVLLPILGGGHQLYNAEVPGLKSSKDMLTSRLSSMSALTLLCYIIWSLLVTVTYRCSGMATWFDAITHAMSTVATGGFSTHSENFGFFHSPLLEWEAAFFMLISAFNLLLMVKLFYNGKFEYHKDEELRWFCYFAGASTLIFTLQMKASPLFPGSSFLERMRVAFFHVTSIMSSTGFTTSDYVSWNLPGLPGIILFLLLCGGCGGSTAGGLKIARFLTIVKQSKTEIMRKIFPHLVPNIAISHTRLESTVVRQTMGFFALYIVTIIITTLLLPYVNMIAQQTQEIPMDFMTAFSAAITAISNVGPGLGGTAPSYTFAWMSPYAKLLLSLVMIMGRLELISIFIVFCPSFWRTHRTTIA